jgi:hypothetical protein
MADESERQRVADVMRAINEAWLDGRVDDMAPALHSEIVMMLPGFSGQVRGREPFLAGFRDFIQNATIHEFHEHDHQIDVVGDTAVMTFTYEMLYTRSAERYRASGRDLWIFQQQGAAWVAVWRTMLDLNETPA